MNCSSFRSGSDPGRWPKGRAGRWSKWCSFVLGSDRGTLVAEVAAVSEDHRRAGFFDRVDYVLVALRPTGLDDRLHAGVKGDTRAIWEGEERVRGERRARDVVTELACLLDGDLDRI